MVRAAVGTFGIDIVMEQPATEIYAETMTAAADGWSSVLDGTEWESRDPRAYCTWWEHSVPLAGSGNDLVIWARRETDPSYRPGAGAWSCRRGEGPETEPSRYYPVAGQVTTNARVPHYFGKLVYHATRDRTRARIDGCFPSDDGPGDRRPRVLHRP